MRLGLYIPFFDSRPTGVGVYVDEVCKRLVRACRDFVVYTANSEVSREWIPSDRVRTFGSSGLPKTSRLDGARRRARRLAWLSGPVKTAVVRDGVDVLFSPVQEGPLVETVPSVVVMHDLTALRFPRAYSIWTVAQTRLLVPLMLQRCSRVIAVSQSTRRDLEVLLGVPNDKTSVVGEGFDPGVFRPYGSADIEGVRARLNINGRFLLYAGTFSRHKNLGAVLRAMRDLPADISFVVVGRRDSGSFAEFELTAKQLGVAGRLRFPGYVERRDLAVLMSAADAFVFPSQYEGFGLAPLEALACGALVVASDVSSLPEVVGSAGVLVRGSAPNDWVDGILKGLSLDRAEVAAAAVKQASQFNWDDAVRLITEVLQREAYQAR